jgi:hypothetical protein
MGCSASRAIKTEPYFVSDADIAAETMKYNKEKEEPAKPVYKNRWNPPQISNSSPSDANLKDVVKLCGI